MGRGRHNPGPLLAVLAATATAMVAATLAFRRRAPRTEPTDSPRHFGPRAAAPLRPPTPADAPATQPPPDAEPSADLQPPVPAQPADPPAPDQPAGAAQPRVAEPAAGPVSGDEGPGGVAQEWAAGGRPRHLADGSGRGRALVGVLVAVGVVILLAVGALVVAGSGSEGTDAATATTVAPRAETTEAPTTTTTVPASPEEAFASAAERLEAAGSFGYRGTVSASDVSAVRPSLWLAVDITVEGEASLADGRVHEVAVAANGRATETVVAGAGVWGRSARSRDGLADAVYEGIPGLSQPEPQAKGAAALARWLAAVDEPRAAGVDEQGRRTYAGTLPAAALGPTERGRRAVDADVLLTLDRAGAPVHVEITTVPAGPPLHLAFDLARLGAPVTIEPPA